MRPASGGEGGDTALRRQQREGEAAAFFGGSEALWDPDEWADLERELVEEALAEEAEEHSRAEEAALEALLETHQRRFVVPQHQQQQQHQQPAPPRAAVPAEEVAAAGSCPLCGVRGALAATAGGALACSAFAFANLDGGGGNIGVSGGASPLPCRFSVSSPCGPGNPAPTLRELAAGILEAERAHAATGCPVSAPGRTLMGGGGGEGSSSLTVTTLFVSCAGCGFLEAAL